MYSVSQPDPAWTFPLQERGATLWLGPNFPRLAGAQPAMVKDVLVELLLRPWASVVADSRDLPLQEVESGYERVGSLVLRVLTGEEGSGRIPPNRLPIFALPDRGAGVRAMQRRFDLIGRAPLHRYVVAVGVDSPDGMSGLAEAVELAPAVGTWILVDPEISSSGPLESAADAVFHWPVGLGGLRDLLRTIGEPDATPHLIAVRSSSGIRAVDLSGAVDPSYPITRNFEIVPASAALLHPEKTVQELRALLQDPTGSWIPYAADIPVPRHRRYESELWRALNHVERDGGAASITTWIPAEEASGATTVLRQLCVEAARRGYPVLIARPDASQFDFKQLTLFLTRAAERLGHGDEDLAHIPWVLAFDANHTQLQSEFVTGVAHGLRNLLRPVVVVAVQPMGRYVPGDLRAHGANRDLGPVLLNTVGLEEAYSVGEHLAPLLPQDVRKTQSDWERFAEETVRSVMGRSSLFWMSLRFWVFRVPGAVESLRTWLGRKLAAVEGDAPGFYGGFLDVAAFARYRLPMPIELMVTAEYRALRSLARDPANAFGLRNVDVGLTPALTIEHPMVAEELLIIASGEEAALAAVGKDTCVGLQDLQLHLLKRIISRPSCGNPDILPIIEDLVTTGLRVDPHEMPANYSLREEIVSLLEEAPDAVWDQSQLFNHHLAKARRHLAADPPDPSTWDLDARIEQLELAEAHLLDAIENVVPEDDDRRESSLNLHISLALTLDWRARLEAEAGRQEIANHYRDRAEAEFAVARREDADNTYVLENFARFKIKRAREEANSEERTRLLVDAITMLNWELEGSAGGRRESTILGELARAYEVLEQDSGRARLRELAAIGSEAAATALANLVLYDAGDHPTDEALEEAEEMLRKIPLRDASWRSLTALYRVVSMRHLFDFPVRLEVLRHLDRDPDFAWPLQLLLEYGILLFQVGDAGDRRKARDVFRKVRDLLPQRSASLTVPNELRFLADPTTGYRERLMTSVVVKSDADLGRNLFAVPRGWFNVEVVLRPVLFAQQIRANDEIDCFIRFTQFGPQAVPTTTE